jgi:hypothetical protein
MLKIIFLKNLINAIKQFPCKYQRIINKKMEKSWNDR